MLPGRHAVATGSEIRLLAEEAHLAQGDELELGVVPRHDDPVLRQTRT
jgi:hypothetical protein